MLSGRVAGNPVELQRAIHIFLGEELPGFEHSRAQSLSSATFRNRMFFFLVELALHEYTSVYDMYVCMYTCIYIYIYMCVCVCVCGPVLMSVNEKHVDVCFSSIGYSLVCWGSCSSFRSGCTSWLVAETVMHPQTRRQEHAIHSLAPCWGFR